MESTRKQITQKQLKELLNYEKDTGIFMWRNSRKNSVKIGDRAGSKTSRGYVIIGINIGGKTRRYYAHRLAWLYIYGSFPEEHLDHINHDKLDNKIANLREANNAINNKNTTMSKNNKSGINGVCWVKNRNKWQAQIHIKGKTIYLGAFENKDDAIMARSHANRLYKFHPNHGKC